MLCQSVFETGGVHGFPQSRDLVPRPRRPSSCRWPTCAACSARTTSSASSPSSPNATTNTCGPPTSACSNAAPSASRSSPAACPRWPRSTPSCPTSPKCSTTCGATSRWRRTAATASKSRRCCCSARPASARPISRKQLAELLGTGMSLVPMSSMTAGWLLSGASSQWKGAKPGKVFEALVDGQYANPVMVIDEIDKAGADAQYDPLGALYSLLEHDTAHAFVDEFAEVPIDASQVIWITTANDVRGIPEPILNRMNVFEIEAPSPEAARQIARQLYASIRKRARLGPPAGRGAFGRRARPPGHAGAARDAARADDRLRQCPPGRARRGARRGPAARQRRAAAGSASCSSAGARARSWHHVGLRRPTHDADPKPAHHRPA